MPGPVGRAMRVMRRPVCVVGPLAPRVVRDTVCLMGPQRVAGCSLRPAFPQALCSAMGRSSNPPMRQRCSGPWLVMLRRGALQRL